MTGFVSRAQRVAPFTAAALIAQQVGANALRDGLFLSLFPVEVLPYFMAGTAILAILAADSSGRLLSWYGPVIVVPSFLGSSALLFLVEWLLFGWDPRAAAMLLYLHCSVLGAITISAFWSLLNERFDPYSAKPLMARVAAAATFGGLVGGVGAERVAAILPHEALFIILGLVGVACVGGVMAVSQGAPKKRAQVEALPDTTNAWIAIRRQPFVRDLALIVGVAAVLAALVDYLLKVEAVAYFGRGEPLVRFFGLFYAGTGLAAVVIQSSLGKQVLARFGLGGSVAAHPVAVGALSILGFVMPTPWRGVLPRGLDVAVRNSVFRAGYELLYTPLPEDVKRAAKSFVDVAIDCAGKGVGAALILLLVTLAPRNVVVAVNLAAVVAAGAELFVARRLRDGYVRALEGGLRRQSDEDLEPAPQYSLADFTVVGTMAGFDRAAVLRTLESPVAARDLALPNDATVAAIMELRSGDLVRIRKVLAELPRDPLLVGALVPLLAHSEAMRLVIDELASFGTRAAGEMVSALLDPDTPAIVRRRLPLVLKTCPSPIARDGLLSCLTDDDFELRLRCGRALLALTDDHPELSANFPTLAAVSRELGSQAEAYLVREHVFNLLALALEREPVRIAARSFATEDAYVRGTALEYLETVLPSELFSALQPLLAGTVSPPVRRRTAVEARDELIRAGSTMVISREELQKLLDSMARDES